MIKADVGSYPGHGTVHPQQIEVAKALLEKARKDGAIVDFFVTHAGDDLEFIMTHRRGENDKRVHQLA